MERAYSNLEIRAVDEEQRIVEGIANSASVDSHGTVIEPEGAVFRLPLPFHWHHERTAPVGEVVASEIRDGKRWVQIRLPKIADDGTDGGREVKRRVDSAWADLKNGLVRGLSIEFDPIEPKSRTAKRWTRWRWLGLAGVTIPSNMDATILAIRSADEAARAASSPGLSGTEATPSPGVSGTTDNKRTENPSRRRTVKTYQEQIQEHANTRAAKVAAKEALIKEAEERGETLDASEAETFDTLDQEIRSIDSHIRRLETLQRDSAAKATPVSGMTTEAAAESRAANTPAVRTVKLRAHEEPGVPMARVVRSIAVAHRKHRDPNDVARELYADDNLVRAAVSAHTSTDSAALVGDEGGVYADFLEYLRPRTLVGQFGTDGVPSLRTVPFRTPLISQTSGGAGYWVGEGAAKPLTKFAWGKTTLDPLKVANIAVITDELMKSSSPAADGMIRDSLVDALRERLDIDFIDPNKAAVASESPASITNGVTRIRSSGNTEADVRTDVRAVFKSFIDANNPPTQGVWIMPATTALALSLMANVNGEPTFPGISMNGGRLFGLPVILSQYVPDDFSYVESTVTYTGAIVALVNASDIYVADEGGFAVDASREASLQMDDAPTGSSATPTASTLVSMFQTNSVALRAERTINWARRRDSGVAVLDTVNWGE